MRKFFSVFLGVILIILLFNGFYFILSKFWKIFQSLDTKVVITAITAFTTVTVSTLTVVLGKYYERKKDIETHYRGKKTEIYDEFLMHFFNLFDSNNIDTDQQNVVKFFREWQRKIVIWGGQEVLIKYVEWMDHLRKGSPDAKTLLLMEDFFKEIRKDLDHNNFRIEKGVLTKLILKDSEKFFEVAEKNPNLTLTEFDKLINNEIK
jgi:hypothetical protein